MIYVEKYMHLMAYVPFSAYILCAHVEYLSDRINLVYRETLLL